MTDDRTYKTAVVARQMAEEQKRTAMRFVGQVRVEGRVSAMHPRELVASVPQAREGDVAILTDLAIDGDAMIPLPCRVRSGEVVVPFWTVSDALATVSVTVTVLRPPPCASGGDPLRPKTEER